MKAFMLPIALMALAVCSISSASSESSESSAKNVRDSDPAMVSGCRYVDDVYGFDTRVKRAREAAKAEAAKLGATNIVWRGPSMAGNGAGRSNFAISGRAYVCAGSTKAESPKG